MVECANARAIEQEKKRKSRKEGPRLKLQVSLCVRTSKNECIAQVHAATHIEHAHKSAVRDHSNNRRNVPAVSVLFLVCALHSSFKACSALQVRRNKTIGKEDVGSN